MPADAAVTDGPSSSRMSDAGSDAGRVEAGPLLPQPDVGSADLPDSPPNDDTEPEDPGRPDVPGASGIDPIDPLARFHIELLFVDELPVEQQLLFRNAAARWERYISSELEDVVVERTFCGVPSELLPFEVDDLVVVVSVPDIDGEGGIVGAAGPRCVRLPRDERGNVTAFLPATASIQIDRADLNLLVARDQLGIVVLHELGHALGIGSGWRGLNLLENPVCNPETGACGSGDPRYRGSEGVEAWEALGFLGFVPVEAFGGSGSADSHWRESIFGNELMSPTLSSSDRQTPISSVTLGALEDLGYSRTAVIADDFVPLASSLRADEPAAALSMQDDVLQLPIYEIRPRL